MFREILLPSSGDGICYDDGRSISRTSNTNLYLALKLISRVFQNAKINLNFRKFRHLETSCFFLYLFLHITKQQPFPLFSQGIINPHKCLLKNDNFQAKQPMTKKHNISLNSQFTVVLNSIIYFSLRFCYNSLLVLKMRFQVSSFRRKKLQGFSSDREMLISL